MTTSEIEQLRSHAKRAEARGSWQAAAGLYEQILQRPDANFWDNYWYIRALVYSGHVTETANLIARIHAPSEHEYTIPLLKAEIAEQAERHEEAEALWFDAQKLGGPPYWCLFGQARAAWKLGRIDDARKLMKRALSFQNNEQSGKDFAALLEMPESASDAEGQLIRFDLARNDSLAEFSFDELLAETLWRIKNEDSSFGTERTLSLAQNLQEKLETLSDVHLNRFSVARLRDLFSTFYNSLQPKPEIQGATILDLGSGSHNPFALLFLFLMLGAQRGIALDLEGMQAPERAWRAMARSADVLLTDPVRILGNYSIPKEEIEKNLLSFNLDEMRKGRDGAGASRLQFIRASASQIPIHSESVDLAISNSFLEHVDDPSAVLAEIARVTVPGGLSIHNIDGADHDWYGDPALHPLTFLRDRRPGKVGGCNRIRVLEFVELFRQHGFSIEQIIPIKTIPVTDSLRDSFAMPWQSMPKEFLELIVGVVVARRL